MWLTNSQVSLHSHRNSGVYWANQGHLREWKEDWCNRGEDYLIVVIRNVGDGEEKEYEDDGDGVPD